MARNNKVKPKPTQLTNKNSSIRPTLINYDELISFSFKYLATNHNKFTFETQEITYFNKFILRLKDLSVKKMTELKAAVNVKALRFHSINWEKESLTERCFNLPGEEDICCEPYQFGISANEHGRVHGFLIDTTFFIVWLDPEHKLDPGQGR